MDTEWHENDRENGTPDLSERRRSARMLFLFGPNSPNNPDIEHHRYHQHRTHQANRHLHSHEAVDQHPLADNVETSTNTEHCISLPPLFSQRSFSVPGAIIDPLDIEIVPENSNMQTLTNMIRCSVGAGVLSLSHGFKEAGIIAGFLGILGYGLLNAYNVNQILCVFNKVNDGRSNLGLAKLAKITFQRSRFGVCNRIAKSVEVVVNIMLIFVQIGVISVLMVFVGRMAKEVMDIAFPNFSPFNISHVITAILVLLMPYSFVTSLKLQSIFSTISNFINIICLIVIFQYAFQHLQPVVNLTMFGDFHGFFSLLGTVMFSFHTVPVSLPLRAHMKTPEDFGGCTGVVTLGTTIITVMYSAVGFYGYLAFGPETLFILRNLPDTLYICFILTKFVTFSFLF